MKQTSTQPRRSSSTPRKPAPPAVRQLSSDQLILIQAGVFGGGLSRENFVVDGGEG